MSNEKHISYLKEKYIDRVRPLKTVNEVIDLFKKEMDIIQIKESDLSVLEEPHFKFLKENYRHAFNTDPSTIEFHFFLLQKNEKSKYYYVTMQNEEERIIIVTESKANLILSNCPILSLDLQIDRGIDQKYIQSKSIELMEYLSLFEFRDSF